MNRLPKLFENNRSWAAKMRESEPNFFTDLAEQQSPQYLWIGCSDSRVPANQIIGLQPGEVFVHRNVANAVIHSDLNCLSVIQYAVEVLGVTDVIVCGHYGCGGVNAALDSSRHGLVDNWLGHVRDIRDRHLKRFESGPNMLDRLCELNVAEQVLNVCRTTVLEDAWDLARDVAVHGWIYDIRDGKLHDLGLDIQKQDDAVDQFDQAVERILAPE
ncbi:MAG: carbonic anhydrase [Rhodothermales bacterium]|jgi:carbonic anhydrase